MKPTDLDRMKFLGLLLANQRDERNGLILGEWEQNFLNSYAMAERQTLWFTDGRRQAVDRMWQKFGGEKEINFPHPLDTVAVPEVKADVDGCQFFVRVDGRQQPCNEPAEWENRSGFRYCAPHNEQVQKDLTRRGGRMEVRLYKPKTKEVV
jgi:hypothetical protein